MATDPKDYAERWLNTNIYSESADESQVDELVSLMIDDAQEDGIEKADLEQTLGDLYAYVGHAIRRMNG